MPTLCQRGAYPLSEACKVTTKSSVKQRLLVSKENRRDTLLTRWTANRSSWGSS